VFRAGELGGVTIESYSDGCTHVVATHALQECCIAARHAGKHVVNIDWADECRSRGVLLRTDLVVRQLLSKRFRTNMPTGPPARHDHQHTMNMCNL
jgi:hypothetical protein